MTWGDPTSGGDCSNVVEKLLVGAEQVYSTAYAFAALKKGGEVITWGDSSSGADSSLVADRLTSGVVQIFTTNAAFAALKADGTVVTWVRT